MDEKDQLRHHLGQCEQFLALIDNTLDKTSALDKALDSDLGFLQGLDSKTIKGVIDLGGFFSGNFENIIETFEHFNNMLGVCKGLIMSEINSVKEKITEERDVKIGSE